MISKELDIFIKSGIPIICIKTSVQERIKTIKNIYNFANSKTVGLNLWNPGWEVFKRVDFQSNELYFSTVNDVLNLNYRSKTGSEIFHAFNYVNHCQGSRFFVVEYSFKVFQEKSSFFFKTKLLSQVNNLYYELKKYNQSQHSKILIFLITESQMPSSMIPTITTPLPNIQEIPNIIQNHLGITQSNLDISELVNACSGLNSEEIHSACALACASLSIDISDTSQVLPHVESISKHVADYKMSRFQDMGLSFINCTDQEALPDFGGFDLLKKFISNIKFDFSTKAREAKIPLPKGCLLVGPPGTGKTLSARVCAKILGFPLVNVDTATVSVAGVDYLKGLIERVEACAPCILYLDEFDKLFDVSGDTGSERNSRSILAILLTWLQDKKTSVFVIATLNRFSSLPPELTRVGRFDEIFWLGFPQAYERKEILNLHLSRFDSRYKNADPLTEKEWRIILNKTLNLTGAELARCVEKAASELFRQGKEIKIGLEELLTQREQIIPLFFRDTDRILAISNQAKHFSQPASSPDTSEFAPTPQSYWGDVKKDVLSRPAGKNGEGHRDGERH